MTVWTLVVLLFIGRASMVVPDLPDRAACERLGQEVTAEAAKGNWPSGAARFWCVETVAR